MRALLRFLCVFALVGISTSAFSQQYFTNTGVTRVVKYRIKPGKTADFYKWLSNAPKILGAEKDAGLIEGFHFLHSTEFIGQDKYDVALVINYKNMAALDDLSVKAEPVVAKAWGSPEARAAANKLADESMEVVSAELIRNIELK
jgi:hypothetical protein